MADYGRVEGAPLAVAAGASADSGRIGGSSLAVAAGGTVNFGRVEGGSLAAATTSAGNFGYVEGVYMMVAMTATATASSGASLLQGCITDQGLLLQGDRMRLQGGQIRPDFLGDQ